jgi:signal peptidase II
MNDGETREYGTVVRRDSRASRQRPSRGTAFILFALLLVALVSLDQLTKTYVRAHLSIGMHVPVIPGAFGLTLVFNGGAAFGLLYGRTWLFVAVAGAFVAFSCVYLALRRHGGFLGVVAVSLVSAGALGNMIDRITSGYVTDFIEALFMEFPIFNVADICVTVGIIALFFALLFDSRKADLPEADSPEGEDGGDDAS